MYVYLLELQLEDREKNGSLPVDNKLILLYFLFCSTQ